MPAATRSAPTRAERRARTRGRLVEAARVRFERDGFHATSVDAVADEAGYTKGAVYSNFASKEELFFAVYEQRIATRTAQVRRELAAAPSGRDALRTGLATLAGRRDDGWMALFFEVWAHVLRHPEHRARFAELHRRAQEPYVEAIAALAAEHGAQLPVRPELFAVAQMALGNGLQLERLTDPAAVDETAFTDAMWLLARATVPQLGDPG